MLHIYKTGIKAPNQYKYDDYLGDNGTHVTGEKYYRTVLNVRIKVFDYDKTVTFNAYDDILAITGMRRMSGKLLKKMISHKSYNCDAYTHHSCNFYVMQEYC